MDDEIKVSYRISRDGWCQFSAEVGGEVVDKDRIHGASDDQIRQRAEAMMQSVCRARGLLT